MRPKTWTPVSRRLWMRRMAIDLNLGKVTGVLRLLLNQLADVQQATEALKPNAPTHARLRLHYAFRNTLEVLRRDHRH